jgi:hypothetical protein
VADWNAIRQEYITDESSSYRKLAQKYGVGMTSLYNHAKSEDWVGQRKQLKDKSITKSIETISKKRADKLSRVMDITDKLLDKLERAVDELDIHLVTKATKVKEIEYNNDLRPDKPTKETITETEEILESRMIVDRAGLKAIASSLRDIKEIQMLKSELDKQEQEARIANLRRQAEKDDIDNAPTLVVEGLPEEFKV